MDDTIRAAKICCYDGGLPTAFVSQHDCITGKSGRQEASF